MDDRQGGGGFSWFLMFKKARLLIRLVKPRSYYFNYN